MATRAVPLTCAPWPLTCAPWPLTRQLDQMREAFELFDADGSGSIDLSELEAAMGALGLEVEKQELEQMIIDVDVNGSGEIDFPEFVSMMTGKMGAKAEQIAQAAQAELEARPVRGLAGAWPVPTKVDACMLSMPCTHAMPCMHTHARACRSATWACRPKRRGWQSSLSSKCSSKRCTRVASKATRGRTCGCASRSATSLRRCGRRRPWRAPWSGCSGWSCAWRMKI